jgi:hypothetical protein
MPAGMSSARSLVLTLSLAFLLLAGSPPPQVPGEPAKPVDPKPAEGDDKSQPRRTFQMEEIEIMGEMEKPKAMFVIPKAYPRYYWEAGKKDFTDDILLPINKQYVDDMLKWQNSLEPP